MWRNLYPILMVMMMANAPAQAQTGVRFDLPLTVTDLADGQPLPGVNVYLNNEPYSTTNLKGQLTLEQVQYLDSVRLEFIGYSTIRTTALELRGAKGKVQMDNRQNLLNQVTVWGRRDDDLNWQPQQIEFTKGEAALEWGAQTTADALELDNKAFVQKSQMGGGSPILRGFEANKVLLVVDGVRMNNLIYRNGHLQNAITIDPAMLEQIEVIYGPGSLIYGSDALGGVIHFRTRDPFILSDADRGKKHLVKHRAFTRLSTANQERSVHYDLNYGNRRFGLFTSLSFSDFDDLRAGSQYPEKYPDFGKRPYFATTTDGIDQVVTNPEPEIQIGTGYHQFDFLQKVRYRPNEQSDFLLNVQYSTTSNIPRYDQLTEAGSEPRSLKFAEWYYGPQKRFLSSLKYRSLHQNQLYDKATFIAAFQRIQEDRLDRRFGNPNRAFNLEDVKVYSLTADFDKSLNPGSSTAQHKLAYGLEGNYNTLESSAGLLNIRSGETTYGTESTRYPSGGSSMTMAGAYAHYQFLGSEQRFSWNAGLRYSLVGLEARFRESDPFDWPEAYTDGVQSWNSALTWSLGATWKTADQWEFRALASTAFRSPNIDDFGKIRPKRGNVTVPNIDLSPEHALSGELSVGKGWGEAAPGAAAPPISVSVTGFYTYLTDAIVRVDADLFGDTLILFDGEQQRVQTNINANAAFVYGFSANGQAQWQDHWHLRVGITYTYGRETVDGQRSPLSHIPPVYGMGSLEYRRTAWSARAVVRFNGQKPLSAYDLNGSDNADQASPEGSLAWVTYNLYGSWHLNPFLRLQLGAENLTDLHYRTFSSGISAPGRNFFISAILEI